VALAAEASHKRSMLHARTTARSVFLPSLQAVLAAIPAAVAMILIASCRGIVHEWAARRASQRGGIDYAMTRTEGTDVSSW
jgi:hypothetical protein